MKRAILIVDHGSKHPGADSSLLELVRHVRELVGTGTQVECAHMEFEEPTVAQGYRRCVEGGATDIVVLPLMLAPGRHATVDIPALVEAAAAAHQGVRFTVAAPLGGHRKIAEIVMERLREAEADR